MWWVYKGISSIKFIIDAMVLIDYRPHDQLIILNHCV